jgi:UDP-N-acetylmuramate-alanine ligase
MDLVAILFLQADEYDGAFLDLRPRMAVVTNVEWEHVDIFPDEVGSMLFACIYPCSRCGSDLCIVAITDLCDVASATAMLANT